MKFEPVEFKGLNEEGAKNYYRVKIDIAPFVKKQVIVPFEDALKEYTGYNGKKIPESVEETELKCPDIPNGKFVIKTIPKIKKPSYKDVYEEIRRFFWKGYSPVDVGKFLDDITGFKESITEKSINQEINPKHEELDERLNGAEISIISEPKKDIMIPAKGLMYLRAAKLHENFAKYISDFDASLRESAGVDKNLEEKRIIEKQIGNTLFIFRATPSESTEYGEIYKQFISELSAIAGKKPELPKTKAAQEKAIERYKELRQEAEKYYAIIILGKDKKPHIELKNMVERLDKLKDKYTKPSISESVNFYAIS